LFKLSFVKDQDLATKIIVAKQIVPSCSDSNLEVRYHAYVCLALYAVS